MTPPSDPLDAWAADAPPAAKDKLDRLRAKAEEARELTLRVAECHQALEDAKRDLARVRDKEMVDIFAEAGVDDIRLEARGNLPRCRLEVKPYYHATIAEENKPAAHAWLREHGSGGLIKSEFKVSFGKGEDAAAKGFAAYCAQNGWAHERKEGVHYSTLTAFVRSEVEAGRDVPMDLLGATVGSTTKITMGGKK